MRIGITGHRGLSSEVERRVRLELAALVASLEAADLVVVSCIADGPDAWLAQEVLARGGRLEVVVPAESYREGLPLSHHAEYDELMRRAVDVHATGLRHSDSHAHMAGSELMVGLVDRLVAVWDGEPARGYGGTADVVAYAERNGVPTQVVWPDGASR
ncbi:hypothetical protein J7W19_25675 [Streptomyces mobaraensis NBRC 13819 = DSM 40847]|uniref:Uncharacterized protein n=1 Tax=Streptomyces mobaraensis (strain ATCC 29032 / DSM 40847 / JCM 4168 / NBRC 13819 / NCIMB 11159 / IPCR 16-22) TaxID=1223523 RepID=M3C9N5_STRM1|nr:hypothetical protein [Streptomyces mobaraensis]EMF00752.1 hypothetical protein H340_09735 [Streptomyces mobaraensis NBRC 13819 = DSM 40847]QTT76318.1 hypothetical protein J7W19_25675 [Streptomyces mobaraensis NBRC 13819 = DSM 40847]